MTNSHLKIIDNIERSKRASTYIITNMYKTFPKILHDKYQDEIESRQQNNSSINYYDLRENAFLNKLSKGCLSCKDGKWLCIYITTNCNASCRFCPNKIYTSKKVLLDGVPYSGGIEGIISLIADLDIKGISFSGGEPLLEYKKVIFYLEKIKSAYPDLYVWMYTNGIKGSKEIYQSLRNAGLDEIRFDLTANNYSTKNLVTARTYIPFAAVEIPAIPSDRNEIISSIDHAESLGFDYFHLSELMLSPNSIQNIDIPDEFPIVWNPFALNVTMPVYQSRMLVYDAIDHAIERGYKIGINDCSLSSKLNVQIINRNINIANAYAKPWEQPTRGGYLGTLSVFGDKEEFPSLLNKLKSIIPDPSELYVNQEIECIQVHPDNLHAINSKRDITENHPLLLILYNPNLFNGKKEIDMAFAVTEDNRYYSLIKGIDIGKYL